jgi:hypothetical protein
MDLISESIIVLNLLVAILSCMIMVLNGRQEKHAKRLAALEAIARVV